MDLLQDFNMAARAVDNIFKILESEKTMEDRKNVAAEISIAHL